MVLAEVHLPLCKALVTPWQVVVSVVERLTLPFHALNVCFIEYLVETESQISMLDWLFLASVVELLSR